MWGSEFQNRRYLNHFTPVERIQCSCCWKFSSNVIFLLFGTISCLSTKFEDGWSPLRPTEFIRLKPYLTIDLRKSLYTADGLDVSERVGCHTWHLYESLDLTRLFKDMTRVFNVFSNSLWCCANLLLALCPISLSTGCPVRKSGKFWKTWGNRWKRVTTVVTEKFRKNFYTFHQSSPRMFLFFKVR